MFFKIFIDIRNIIMYYINTRNLITYQRGGENVRLNTTKVRLFMAKQVINQASLAAKAGISRQTLSAVMNGRSCRPELLGKISRALGVEPEEIIE